MKNLTDDEKTIVRRLRNSPPGSMFLANVIDRELNDVLITIKKGERVIDTTGKIGFDPDVFTNEQAEQAMHDVLYILRISFALIDYLHAYGLVSFHPPTIVNGEIRIGAAPSNKALHEFPLNDPTLLNQIVEWGQGEIRFTPGIDEHL